MPHTIRLPAPNAEQQAILDAFGTGAQHVVVSAGPGCGKSNLLLRALVTVDLEHTRVWLSAFSNEVARNLARRVPEHEHLAVSTVHAHGLLALRRLVGHTYLWPQKYAHLARLVAADAGGSAAAQEGLATCLESLATRAMLTLTDPTDPDALYRMALDHTTDLGAWDRAWPLVAGLIAQGRELVLHEGQVSYVDMLYVPHVLGLDGLPCDLLMLDEAQDTSAAQRSTLLRALAPGARVLAAGDPRQAVYSFLGADVSAFGRLIDALGAQEYRLRTCYRCPRTHIDLANRVYPALEAPPRARLGTVEELPPDQAQRDLRPGDLVLCRTGGPLLALAHRLIERGTAARVLGRDLGPGLQATITHTMAQPGFDAAEFDHYLSRYAAQTQETLEEGGAQAAIALATLCDHVHTLRALWTRYQPGDMEALRRQVHTLTHEDHHRPAVELATVHRAKGLEAERVFVLSPDLLPHPRAVTPAQQEQERNLRYVALTRSKQALYFIQPS